MSIGAELGQNILQTRNSKNSDESTGVELPEPLSVRQCSVV